jgi:ornithine cyclodeaminase
MKFITDIQVAEVFTMREAIEAMRSAFTQFGNGAGAVLARGRANAELNGKTCTMSAMGAALPGSDVLGTKVYSTVNGQFNFIINLFSSTTGKPIATFEANELTRLRTAAATALATEKLVRKDARILAIFGSGTQARAHIEALLLIHNFDQILVCARSNAKEFSEWIETTHNVNTMVVDAATAAANAHVIVTCTRANDPLFDGNLVQPGTFIAAVGSSKPIARELDDALLSKAATIFVEWMPAAKAEAGEFVRAAAGVITDEKVKELGQFIAQASPRNVDDILIYKSVGIGLEDIAIAKLIFDKLST